MINIKFSPELIEALPQYLGMSRNQFIKQYNLPYSKAYISYVSQGIKPVSKELNSEYNRVWNELGLTYEDLNKIYQLLENNKK